jgi:CBS domain-containing protein/hemerythrin-like domain-containing protein
MVTLRSCDQLRREHALIGQVVAGLAGLAERRRHGSEVPTLPATGAIDFFADFVARCHEAKEEQALYPALEAHGISDGDAMQALRADHEEGARLLGALRPLFSRHQVVDGEAWSLLDAYVGLLRRHISREDGELLPLAERVLSADDDVRLEQAFREIEERELGREGGDALIALAAAVAQASEALAARPAAKGASLRADQLMRPRPGTVSSDDSLAKAAEIMRSIGSRELPVVRGKTLVGILTRTDMEAHRGHFEWTRVGTAMTPDPVTVTPDASLALVARLMLRRGFNGLPVAEHGTLFGMISRSDVLAALDVGEPATV